MIQQETIRQTLIRKLEQYTGCTCVPSNNTKHIPKYPYISFSVLHTETRKGTYSAVIQNRDGKKITTLYMPTLQKWSFTVQSDKDNIAQEKAMMIQDFFAEAVRQELEDHNIVVAEIGAITPRDTLLTMEYEYRKGLDVTIRVDNVIKKETIETIENIAINETIKIT